MKEVFIVLSWFWDGDDWLVNSYVDCFLTEKEALERADIREDRKIYMYEEKIPKQEDGHYGDVGFMQIIKKTFKL